MATTGFMLMANAGEKVMLEKKVPIVPRERDFRYWFNLLQILVDNYVRIAAAHGWVWDADVVDEMMDFKYPHFIVRPDAGESLLLVESLILTRWCSLSYVKHVIVTSPGSAATVLRNEIIAKVSEEYRL